jgi:hypothetical protein
MLGIICRFEIDFAQPIKAGKNEQQWRQLHTSACLAAAAAAAATTSFYSKEPHARGRHNNRTNMHTYPEVRILSLYVS